VNTETGEPLVEDVIVTREHYPGPYSQRLPDLLVRWNRNAPIRSVWSPGIGHVDHEAGDNRTGDHTPEGFCVIAGGDTQALDNAPTMAVTDLAPTIAWYFGKRLSDHDGRVMNITSRAAQTA
jgi:predicted AlkP superfamily phosphohydrolase/phosphomutase